ncbi:MAG: hypothetical protein KJ588_00595 [Gammaproteobacteria bacterium]|nr:hypothetical protein [Gammaproteobacteria bacterium]
MLFTFGISQEKINPTSQLPGYIEELFSDSPNIDCFLRHLISAVVIPSDERKRALATEFVEIVMLRVFKIVKNLKQDGLDLSIWMPTQLLTLFTAEAPKEDEEPTNIYQWREIVREMLKKSEDPRTFDAFGKDLMLYFAEQGQYQALADFMKTLQRKDAVDLCVMDGSEDSQLTKKATNCQLAANKKIILLLTRFLAIRYYFQQYMLISGAEEKDIESDSFFYSFSPGLANKQQRVGHFDAMLQKLIEEGCSFENLRAVFKGADKFSASYIKKGLAIFITRYQPSERYYTLFKALEKEVMKDGYEEDQFVTAFNVFQKNFVRKIQTKGLLGLKKR